MAQMPTTAPMELVPRVRPRGRAVSYAEELGLNETYREAKAAAEALGVLYHSQAQFASNVRRIKAMIDGKQFDITAKLREAQPEMGPTAFERLLKEKIAADEQVVALNLDLLDRQDDLAKTEAEVRANEMILRTMNARMAELGGYFAYLAASKEASTADKLLGQIP